MCTRAREAGHTVVIVDDSPDPAVAICLRKVDALVYSELVHGMGSSRRQAFFWAYEKSICGEQEIVLWTEAEKRQIIGNIPEIIAPIQEGRAEIVVAGRSEKSWETWPEFQRETEQEANAVYARVTGLAGFDPMHGPVAFHRSVAPYFVTFDPYRHGVSDGYIQHYAPLVALADGKAVRSVLVDTCYPPEQRAAEEGPQAAAMEEKRIKQKDTLSADYGRLGVILQMSLM